MLNKALSILYCAVLLFSFSVCAYAKDTITVNFICSVEEDIYVDEYSVVVVCLLNEDEGKSSQYKLYQYNNFSERYELKPGVYSILWARIDNRNDIIFEVKSEDHFDIGLRKAIYFELCDTHELGSTKPTTEPTATQPSTADSSKTSTTKEDPTLHTLFDLSTTDNTDVSETEVISGTSIDVTSEYSETDIITSSDITTTKQTDPSAQQTTKINTTTRNYAREESSRNTAIGLIVIFLILILLAVVIIVIYFKKKRE